MSGIVTDFPVTHAGIKYVVHPRLKADIPGQTAVRYMRFMRPVILDRLELPRSTYGRWIPSVPCHPAHLTVSTLDRRTYRWNTIRNVDVPFDPEVAGKGLSHKMSVEAMEFHFQRALKKPPLVIDMKGIRTDHLRVECDREHPVWPNHGECNGGPFNVPFGLLHPLQAYGEGTGKSLMKPPYQPLLRRKKIQPAAPKGMRSQETPEDVRFEGKYLTVGFSTRRPIMTHLGWDIMGHGHAGTNRLYFLGTTFGMSGPVLRTLEMDVWSRSWTGNVSVRGNTVSYTQLRSIEGLSIDATFTVEADRLRLELRQTCEADLPVLEAEPWRFVWNLNIGNASVAGVPSLCPGRNGDVPLPFMWAADGIGCLSCQAINGREDEIRCQVETYRQQHSLWYALLSGFVLGPRPDDRSIRVIPAGTRSATLEIRLGNFEPRSETSAPRPSVSVKKHWATVFACFRSEYRGFSNNSVSTNCHVNQGPPVEIAASTQRPRVGPDPLALARFTVGRALLDGGGYGYFRNLYLDSDAVLVSSLGRIHQARPDIDWLKTVEPGLRESIDRMAAAIGKEGLIVCHALTGNSGSFRWSSNAMDVVGFGHMDAYVNAWTYRAFRNATALMADLGYPEQAGACRKFADGIKAAYAKYLLNPRTRWVAGWRSRDGTLHDYAFIWVNGVACAFGLLPPATARRALRGLERLRDHVGPGSARMGVPCNLLPICERDHMLPKILGDIQPTFETYTDGSLSGFAATYYLRALSIYGFKQRARKLAQELDEGYAANLFTGGICTGKEFRSWEGVPTGYEGTLIVCLGPLYGMAIEQGILRPPDPEWWPLPLSPRIRQK